MVHILSDTSTLYSTVQAEEAGFAVTPLSVTINGKTFREFDEISAEEFVAIIRQGHMPTSSQPSVRRSGRWIWQSRAAAGMRSWPCWRKASIPQKAT